MKTVDILKAAREQIEKNGTIRYFYNAVNDEGKQCYCAVGHLLKESGFDFDSFNKIDEHRSGFSRLNAKSIYAIFNDSGYISSQIGKALAIIGLTEEELAFLQNVNDEGSKYDILNELNKLIDEYSAEGI